MVSEIVLRPGNTADGIQISPITGFRNNDKCGGGCPGDNDAAKQFFERAERMILRAGLRA